MEDLLFLKGLKLLLSQPYISFCAVVADALYQRESPRGSVQYNLFSAANTVCYYKVKKPEEIYHNSGSWYPSQCSCWTLLLWFPGISGFPSFFKKNLVILLHWAVLHESDYTLKYFRATPNLFFWLRALLGRIIQVHYLLEIYCWTEIDHRRAYETEAKCKNGIFFCCRTWMKSWAESTASSDFFRSVVQLDTQWTSDAGACPFHGFTCLFALLVNPVLFCSFLSP